jgi:hypothetical protein
MRWIGEDIFINQRNAARRKRRVPAREMKRSIPTWLHLLFKIRA